ncbi:MAG: S-methyl-5-thioribose-1-phosphate isomerase [Zoogloeaceae bacterium]|nr:S-methyl-5-thioribose-1-phosphate isomerase [Rhodocyclaceae bacterium]MCP5237949.1 S-methyl-5-thioribose-1-phosphate isomerase [Zoogloeaceae bacterium]
MPYQTLYRDGDGAVILDQTRLPFGVAHRRLQRLEDAADAIRSMQVRGAPLIGATAACGVALAMQTDASDAALASALDVLGATRPTAVNLHWALARMQAALTALRAADRMAVAWSEFAAICAEDIATNAAIGRHGLELIRRIAGARGDRPVRVMTHCNAGWLATLGHGTALAPVYAAQGAGIAVEVWVSETRPRNQGLLTAWELRDAGVAHRLIADNAAGLLMSRGEVDLVITGADRVAANGDTANKIGTYLKALAAHDNGVPFYIAAPRSTIDHDCPSGADIPIEERDGDEVRHVHGMAAGQADIVAIALPGAAVANPAFDVTPARLITAIVTEVGVVPPERLHQLATGASG